ncbi:MAG: TIM barrel protein [Candidatus Pacearchaeota archaeon]|nr:TIM barrel protein [Candidatus Pacearchaeota archaeon]
MTKNVKIGPAGLGSVKDAISNLEKYKSLGFGACEIAFTYSAYIKGHDAVRIGEVAKKLGIRLSVHAHYWINLNSEEDEKVRNSKKRILKCCEIGEILGAHRVVFHPGYYGKRDKLETYMNIQKEISELQEEIKKRGYKIKLAPETTGKVNVFGGVDEIRSLVEQTGCDFCIDFAHVLARDKRYRFREVFEMFKDKDSFHIHFSGIEYGDKGERRHVETPREGFRDLIENLPKGKDITIISESPDPVAGAVLGLDILDK